MPVRELLWVFAAVSSAAAALTLYDKAAAKLRLRRVPESFLLFVALCGGAAAMLCVMLLIRHKTRHLRFMAGLPAMLALQLAAGFWAHVSGLF